MDGYLKNNLKICKRAVNKKKESVIFLVDGKSGKGKSTLSFQIAKYLNKDFSLSDVYFSPEEFLTALTNADKGQVFVFDEAMIYMSRKANSKQNILLMQALSMIRSKQIYLIFNINSVFDLDKNIVLSRAHFLFHLYGESMFDKGRFMAFFQYPSQKGVQKKERDKLKQLYIFGKKYYSYSRPKANFIAPFSKDFVLNEKEYEEKKQKFVNEFLTRTKLKDKDLRNTAIKKLNEKYNLDPKQIADCYELSASQIYRILKA